MSVTLSLIRTFVFRDLIFNKVRTMLTVFGIGLGVAVMLAINLANNTALVRFQESIDLVAGKTNLEVVANTGSDLDERILNKLQMFWNDHLLFTPVIDQLAVVPGTTPDVVQVLGVDMFADPAFRPFAIQHSNKAPWDSNIFSANAAYVGERFAKKYGLVSGGRFKLLINDHETEIDVVDVLAYSGPGKAFGGSVIVMDIGSAQQLFSMKGRISRIDMIVDDAKLPEISARVQSLLPSDVSVERPVRRGAQVQKMLAAFQYNLTALSLIALLVGMFLIYNTMSMTVIRKRSEIGILRALGMSRSGVFGIFLMQALILGTAGSLLGLGAGLVFSSGAVKAVERTVQALYVDQSSADISFNGGTLAIAFAIGLALTVVAAVGPILEAMSVPPADATRRASYELRISRGSGRLALLGCLFIVSAALASLAPAVNGFPVFGYLAATLTIFGVAFCLPFILSRLVVLIRPSIQRICGCEGNLAVLSLGGSLGRTSVAVASLMVGISMMVSLAIMIGSFRETVIVWVNQSLQADLYVQSLSRVSTHRAGRLSEPVVKKIRHIPGVQDVDAFVEFPMIYKGNITNFGAGDLDVLIRHGRLMFVDREKSSDVLLRTVKDPGCVVSETFALRNNVGKGDTLTLNSPKGPFAVVVEGIYYDYASDLGYITVSRALYRRYFNDTFSTTLGVYLNPDVDIEQVRSQMVATLGANTRLNIRTNRELRTAVLRTFDNTFAITYALHGISILVAILGVMNALFALTFEMRRDFAILKYIGASVHQLRKMILLQAFTLGLFGTSSGMIVGFILSLLLINVINKQSFGWTVQLSIPVMFLTQSFGLIMLFSILSGIMPARSATRNISPEAVRAE